MARKKESTIYILKILEKYSSENHFLTQQEIISYLLKDYNLDLERKSVSSSLNALIDLDYVLERGSKGGYALINQVFEKSQILYLLDAIYSSRNITNKNADELIEKLLSTSNHEFRKKKRQLYRSNTIIRTNNKQIFYSIDTIFEAIEKKQTVSFYYQSYSDVDGKKITGEERFKISPYFLLNNNARYYCLGYYNDEYGPLATFRIDNIIDIQIEDDDYVPITNFKEELGEFSIDKYINEHIYLFSGEVIDATLKIIKPSSLAYVYEWFGENLNIRNENGHFVVDVRCEENSLFYWVMQYCEEVIVLSPQKLVDRIIHSAKDLIKAHRNK